MSDADRAQGTRGLLGANAVSGAVMFGVMTAVTVAATRDPELRIACVVMLVAAILRSYLLSIRGVLLGLEHFGRDAAVVIGDRALVLVFVLVALWDGAGL